jgi:hypothetical protein
MPGSSPGISLFNMIMTVLICNFHGRIGTSGYNMHMSKPHGYQASNVSVKDSDMIEVISELSPQAQEAVQELLIRWETMFKARGISNFGYFAAAELLGALINSGDVDRMVQQAR